MGKLLSPKNVLSLIGGVSLIEGIGFYFGAETITTQAFPASYLEGGGKLVGILMHQALASAVFAMGMIILAARNLDISAANKVLKGVGFAFIVFLASGLVHLFTTDITPPMPALVLMAVFIFLSFYTASKKAE